MVVPLVSDESVQAVSEFAQQYWTRSKLGPPPLGGPPEIHQLKLRFFCQWLYSHFLTFCHQLLAMPLISAFFLRNLYNTPFKTCDQNLNIRPSIDTLLGTFWLVFTIHQTYINDIKGPQTVMYWIILDWWSNKTKVMDIWSCSTQSYIYYLKDSRSVSLKHRGICTITALESFLPSDL